MSRPFLSQVITDDSALGGSVIERSLRFDDNDSTWLERTVSSSSNRRTFTISVWIKRSKLGNFPAIFGQTDTSGSYMFYFVFDTSDQLYIIDYDYPTNNYHFVTNRKFRDTLSWYHIVLAVDTTQATNTNRSKLYVNGVQETSFSTANYPSQNLDTWVNHTTYPVRIGRFGWGHTTYFDGYMTEYNFIDGQQLDPTHFGYTESQTELWRPKRYEGTYGTNGFHLDFSDNSSTSALGKDTSGNGNNFTPNNFSVSAGAGNDSVEDTPTNNWCTLNPLAMIATGNVTPSNGNLDASFGTVSGGGGIASTFAVSSGKWYWEIKITATSSARIDIGVVDDTFEPYNGTVRYGPGLDSKSYAYVSLGTKYNNNTDTSYGATYGTNDVIGIALDLDNGTITFYKNNVSQGQAFSGLTGGFSPAVGDGSSAGTHSISANFGQQGFTYTPPTDFKALNLANLPHNVPSIIRPQKHFDTILYTGNGSSQTIGGLEFAPDWVWIKIRSQSYDHAVFDTIRGATKDLETNQTSVEQTRQMLTAFTSNGFSVGNDTQANKSGDTFVAWCWKAGGTAVTNNDGSIASQVSVNEEAGFSIISYTGNNTNNATVGHGLGKTPALLITKSRDNVINPAWHTSHVSLPTNYDIALDASDAAWNPGTNGWHELTNSSVFTLKKGSSDGNNTNRNGDRYIAYCWAEIPGYSKFGSYTGNGNADGAYVHLGFRPSWVLFKRSDSSGNWFIVDNKRDPFNECTRDLYPNTSGTETNNSNFVDFLSDGFKLRTTGTAVNGSGGTYIYMAIAEQPGLTPYDTQTNAR